MKSNLKLAFELGNNSMKIAVAKPGGVQLHEVQMPENLVKDDIITMPHAFSGMLKETKRKLHLPGGPAGLIVPSSQVICRQITMPRMTVEQLMLNLPYEFNDFIQGEIQQYHYDYAMCAPAASEAEQEDAPQEMTMMAAVVEKQRVNQYIRMFAAGGVSLKVLLPEEMALLQLAQAHHEKHADEPDEYCFIDIGYLSTRIFITQGDRVQITRHVPLGCREIDIAVADLLNIDLFLTDAYKRSNHMDVLSEPRCRDVYDRITVELIKLINFYYYTYRQSQLRGVYLIGGGANIQPLRQTLQEGLGMQLLPVDALFAAQQEQHARMETCAGAAGMLLAKEEGR